MTTKELLALPKVRASDAAEYLQNGTYAEEIRARARAHACPFCQAYREPGSKRYVYRIDVGALIRAKWGAMTPPDVGAST